MYVCVSGRIGRAVYVRVCVRANRPGVGQVWANLLDGDEKYWTAYAQQAGLDDAGPSNAGADVQEVYIPVNKNNMHWFLGRLVIIKDEPDADIEMYDSIKQSSQRCYEKIATALDPWLKQHWPTKTFRLKRVQNVMVQPGSNECGPYTCALAYFLSRGVVDPPTELAPSAEVNLRCTILLTILAGSTTDWGKIESRSQLFPAVLPAPAPKPAVAVAVGKKKTVSAQHQGDLLNAQPTAKGDFVCRYAVGTSEVVNVGVIIEAKRGQYSVVWSDGFTERGVHIGTTTGSLDQRVHLLRNPTDKQRAAVEKATNKGAVTTATSAAITWGR